MENDILVILLNNYTNYMWNCNFIF